MTKTLTRGTKGVLASLAVAASLASVSLASPTTANAALAPNSSCAGDTNKNSGQCYTYGNGQYFWLGTYTTPIGKAWCLDYLYDTTWTNGSYASGSLTSALGGGVRTQEQQALAYLATYHGPDVSGSTDAAAISLIIREVMGDGTSASEGRVYPSGLTVGEQVINPTAMGGVTTEVLNRANALWTEASNNRGTWNLALTPATSHGSYNDQVTYTVTVTSSVTGKGIPGAVVNLSSTALNGVPSTVTTNSSGTATFTGSIAAADYSVNASVKSPGAEIRTWVPSGWTGRTSTQSPTSPQRVLGTATPVVRTAKASGTGSAPSIGTTAADKADNDKFVVATGGTIIDKVAYTNLSVNKTYTVSGTLQDKATGKPVTVDGRTVTGTTTFTPTTASGTVDVPITVPANALAGRTVVVFETVSLDGKQVAVHNDISDEGQTVYIPKIGTTATDNADGDTLVANQGTQTVKDSVAYTGLQAGEKYTVSGTLQDRATGKPVLVNGRTITATKTFTAEKSDGTVDVLFQVPGEVLAGKTLVAFETVSHDKNEVAVHADIKDEGQTVHVPSVGTSIADQSDGDRNLPASGGTVVDTVKYSNLIAGQKYTVRGELMNKATKKTTGIKAEATFTAEKTDGTAKVSFTVPAGHDGDTLVAFESIYTDKGKLAGAHTDINDKAQAVSVERPATPPSTPSSPSSTPSVGVSAGDPTGHDGWGPLAGVGAAIIVVGLAGGGYAVYRNRHAGAHE